MIRISLLFLSLAAGPFSASRLLAFDRLARDRVVTCDLVVYGGTSSGIAAAVQAKRMGLSIVVIEPTAHVGGLTTNGLGYTDTGDKRVIGGVAREFYQEVKRHYDKESAWKYGLRGDYARYRPKDDAMWTFEPHVAEAIFENWIRRDKIPVHRRTRLDRKQGVSKSGSKIVSIRSEKGVEYRGKMFIDATYEGDLLAAAGVTYCVGREPNARYQETLNGVQKARNTHNHRFLKPVDPYVQPGRADSGLLPGVSAQAPGEEGKGDRRLQAFCYRLCMTKVEANRRPFDKPENYDARQYELLLRNFEAGDLRWPLAPGMLPNGKTDTNNNGAVSTDNIGKNYDYPEASYAEREEILREHEHYQRGLLWTLASHPRVPEAVRRITQSWGLAKDEFIDNDNWPRQIYVRESRRMISEYVVSELDCRRQRIAEDPVGQGSYNMDSHNVQRYVDANGFAQNEGDVQESPRGAYLISYRSIRPKAGEADNLLAPVCLSASHIAFGSIRMEPVFMILGQSSATAAALAIQSEVSVQDVVYKQLAARLRADGQVLDLPNPRPAYDPLPASRFAGVVVDDRQAKFAGVWSTSSSNAPFVDVGYRHDGNMDQGRKKAVFHANLPAGRYRVRVAYSAYKNRSSRTQVVIRHRQGDSIVTINQRRKPSSQGVFQTVGEYAFEGAAQVEINNTGADGYVIADAIQFELVK